MRLLLVAAALAVAAPQVCAADKDEDKAKEVSLAFLKAFKAKDLDAVMKTVDVPFAWDSDGEAEIITKRDELKAKMKALLETEETDRIPTEVGTVADIPTVKKKLTSERAKKEFELVEKVVGKTGFVVMTAQDGK